MSKLHNQPRIQLDRDIDIDGCSGDYGYLWRRLSRYVILSIMALLEPAADAATCSLPPAVRATT